MNQVKVKDIVRITKGTLIAGEEETAINDLNTNSREVGEHTLFVPLIGEKTDGHNYIENALTVCAATLTMEDKTPKSGETKAWIKVEDTLTAMQDIAAWYRKKLELPIVGVTGSVGKTTTREMIYKTLCSGKKVFQTPKNYNSQVGVPMTLAQIKEEDEIAVLEMGMSEPGEMERLARMVQPDVAVMTCIGVAHIEQLKTQDNICKEKLNILNYMNEDGVLFYNGDDSILSKWCKDIAVKKVTFGLSAQCDYRGEQIKVENGMTHFVCCYKGKKLAVRLLALGEHNVRNALVALAVSDHYGLDMEKAANALFEFEGQRQRVIKTDKCTIIDDTYNASPDSMKASLGVLKDMNPKGKRIAVLADMLELGENTVAYHEQVGEYAAEYQVDILYGYGELSRHILKRAKELNPHMEILHFSDLEKLNKAVMELVTKEDVVLLKGSNGMNLKEVAGNLIKQ